MAAGVSDRHPPVLVVRYVANPVLRLALKSGLGARLHGLGLLTFTTRRTGRHLEIPVGVHRVPSEAGLVVFSDAPWVANFAEPREVTIHVDGRRLTGTAGVSTDRAATAAALRAALAKTTPSWLGLSIPDGYEPTDEELVARRRMVRIVTDGG